MKQPYQFVFCCSSILNFFEKKIEILLKSLAVQSALVNVFYDSRYFKVPITVRNWNIVLAKSTKSLALQLMQMAKW